MKRNLYTCTKKIRLTDDVWKIVFIGPEESVCIAGQFLTFFIDGVWPKMYSILEKNGNQYIFIIKEIALNDGWKGGSHALCNLALWDIVPAIGPIGKFVLQNNSQKKLFLGTGTGFVPLWNQIISSLEQDSTVKIKLVFWVRGEKDIFYYQELAALSKKHDHFSFVYYISRAEVADCEYGRITDYLKDINHIDEFEEFYICGNPKMVDEVEAMLQAAKKTNIYFEKY